MRNWTSDLRIPRSSALPLIHRDSMTSEANIMKFVYDFWWLRSFSFTHALDKTKNILLYFFTELKTSLFLILRSLLILLFLSNAHWIWGEKTMYQLFHWNIHLF